MRLNCAEYFIFRHAIELSVLLYLSSCHDSEKENDEAIIGLPQSELGRAERVRERNKVS